MRARARFGCAQGAPLATPKSSRNSIWLVAHFVGRFRELQTSAGLLAAAAMSSKDLTIGERLFGKKKTLKERSKEWQKELRKQQRSIESQIRAIEREENKVRESTPADHTLGVRLAPCSRFAARCTLRTPLVVQRPVSSARALWDWRLRSGFMQAHNDKRTSTTLAHTHRAHHTNAHAHVGAHTHAAPLAAVQGAHQSNGKEDERQVDDLTDGEGAGEHAQREEAPSHGRGTDRLVRQNAQGPGSHA